MTSQIHDIASRLANASGFSEIPFPELQNIAQQIKFRNFSANEFLMRRGDKGYAMHLILEGRVCVQFPNNCDNHNTIYLTTDDVVGEMALLTDAPRIADVIATTPVTTYELNREALEPILIAHPVLANFLTAILVRRIDATGGIKKIGKHQIVRQLAHGSTAKVYEAIHADLGRAVAIKMLDHALVYDKSFYQRFVDEAKTIAALSHPNIVQLYDMEMDFGTLFLIMEKVDGINLKELLNQRHSFNAYEAISIIYQIGSALAYAHREGIVHRDIKPGNCVLNQDGLIKLMDFGLSRHVHRDLVKPNKTFLIEGTPAYIAPEIVCGNAGDERADIYALGVMAYQLITGHVPFRAATNREVLFAHMRKEVPDIVSIIPHLPQGIFEFIHGALIKNPNDRLSDWSKILGLLDKRAVFSVRSNDQQEVVDFFKISYPRSSVKEVKKTLQKLATIDGVALSHQGLMWKQQANDSSEN